ncbi:MAG: phosphoribosylamine--glycine ligase [Erysipelotrichaceae bacterium]
MKILIIGKGGREHALACKVAQSPLVSQVFVAPGNAGMRSVATLVNIQDTDVSALLAFALQEGIDLTIPGCEAALEAGIVDTFEANGLRIFGPTKRCAQIETSKAFAKDLMDEYGIKTAAYHTFEDYEQALHYALNQRLPLVIKEDGLKAGKGVVIASTWQEVKKTLQACFLKPNKVVIEQFLEGFEFSFICMVARGNVVAFSTSQDHKRAYDFDQGPNTGGMGVYAPVERIDESITAAAMEEIMIPTVNAMADLGMDYTGFLYGGLMLTKEGLYVIEFNARLGDPETQVLLPALESDLVEHLLDLLAGNRPSLRFHPGYFVGVVMASTHYPASSTLDVPITFTQDIDSYVFHMGTKWQQDTYVTGGGRVLLVMGKGDTLEEAIDHAYGHVKTIECDALFYRNDIGVKSLKNNV